ncbi:MAG: UDP-N-acetylmuramoyl-tripeptide--D-alanyl-D-alanine ligase [Chloroflexota bacterium]|nr:UDP-N-acetylmuramoyl-tripeptide--D-alanyl-D-alanine ligase [Chloroflexota bacterium]
MTDKLQFSDLWQALVEPASAAPAELAGQAVHAVIVDSRAAQPNDLFVALRGEKTDGHLYLADAFSRGARAAIAEPTARELGLQAAFVMPDGTIQRPAPTPGSQDAPPPYIFVTLDSLAGLQKASAHWRSQMPAVVIGITGSVGKTTTKEIVANVLEQRFVTLRSEGNLNNEIGLPLTLLRLQATHQRLVLEMGMYALGEIANLCRLARPRIGVVTNVGPTHLERLGAIERIAQAKAELAQALPAADDGGVAILNADDPLVRAMAGRTSARVFTYGLDDSSDLWADEISGEGLEGIRFRFHYGGEVLHVHLPMLGRHSVHTALRGAAVGLVEGLSWAEIIQGLQQQRGQLRLMVVPGLRGATLIDDTYNASPISMLAALNLLDDICNDSHRAVAVLGEMLELGSYEEEGHRLVGGRAAQVADKLITVGGQFKPSARWMAEEALSAGMKPADIYATTGKEDAIAVLTGLLRAGDIVLIKGSRALSMEAIVDALARPTA